MQQALFAHGASRTICCCSSTRTCSPTGRGPTSHTNLRCDPAAGRRRLRRREPRRRHHVPRARTARRLSDPVESPTSSARSATSATSSSSSSTRSPRFGCRRRPARPSTRACGSTPSGPNPRKICAIGVRLEGRAHDARLRAQRRAPTSRTCASTSCRAASPTGPSRRCARRGSTSSMQRGRRRASPGSPANAGATARPSVRTSRGGTARTTSRRSLAAPARATVRHGPARRDVRCDCVRRLDEAGVAEGLSISTRKPEWLRPKVRHGADVLDLKRTIRSLGLVTVCEDAGCPNLSRVLGRRHRDVHGARRAVHASVRVLPRRHAQAGAASRRRAERVAEAIDGWRLDHAVLTMVARDDLDDGGMAHVAACVEAIRPAGRRPGSRR